MVLRRRSSPLTTRLLAGQLPHAVTSAYASYIRARQVYVVDGNKETMGDAQKLVIEVMNNVAEFVDIGAALTLNDSVIEVQFEVLGRLGMI